MVTVRDFWVYHHLIEIFQRDLIFGAVGDPIERMASAERLRWAAALHNLLNFLSGLGKVQSLGTISARV
jgi:hypothetical protein